MRLLLAEDERELSNALVAILKYNHYSVDAVYDGRNAIEYGLAENYDGIILDVMMPYFDGFEVVKLLRQKGIETPVLILTAKSQLEDKIQGLDYGADDYLTKPFQMEELLARVRALTRRRAAYTPNVLEFGNVKLNTSSFELYTDSATNLKLGNKEFQILELLMTNANCLISTEKFMERIWGYDSEAEINVVWVYISYLRKKLLSINADVEIKANRGVGYKLVKKND